METNLAIFSLCMLLAHCQGVELNGPVDLSWPYDEYAKGCPDQDFEFRKQVVNDKEGTVWYAYNTFAVAEHCGTHVDAPSHFDPEGLSLDQLPLDKLLVNAILIDVAEETGDDCNYTMPLTKVKDWENVNGPIPNNSVVIIKFGWASKYKNKEKYLMKEDEGVYRWPGVAPEVSQYFVDSKKVVGAGADGPSVEPGYAMFNGFTTHVTLSKAGIYILENIAITKEIILPPKFKLIVAPMKIGKGTGGPVRLIALPNGYTF